MYFFASIAGAVEQVDAHTPGRVPRDAALSSYLTPTYEQEGLLDYVDDRLPVMRRHLPRVDFPPRSLREDRASATIREPPGQLLDTNIRSTPDLVHITGARIVATDAQADDVLRVSSPRGDAEQETARGNPAAGRARRDDASATTETISVGPADTLPVVLGRLLSAIAVIALALELAIPIYRATIVMFNDRS